VNRDVQLLRNVPSRLPLVLDAARRSDEDAERLEHGRSLRGHALMVAFERDGEHWSLAIARPRLVFGYA
jgi:hypothetical protein